MRHGDDREAGRLRRAREHDARRRRSTAAAPGAEYELTGHKWFCARRCATCSSSWPRPPRACRASRCRACCPTARATPASSIQRLKDKLGNRSNASSEIEFARRLGAHGRRAGSRRADDHRDGQPHPPGLRDRRRGRDARGRRPGDVARRAPRRVRRAARRPARDGERARRPRDRGRGRDAHRDAPRARVRRGAAATGTAEVFKRLATAVAKYWTSASASPGHAAEALECLGGNGYVEASGMPRLYREAPLDSIWEGSGNVMALDVLRALRATPAALDVFLAEADEAAGADAAPRRPPRPPARGPRRPGRHRAPRPPRRRGPRAGAAGLAARPPRAARRGRRVLRRPPRARRARLRHAPRRDRHGAIVARHTPPV